MFFLQLERMSSTVAVFCRPQGTNCSKARLPSFNLVYSLIQLHNLSPHKPLDILVTNQGIPTPSSDGPWDFSLIFVHGFGATIKPNICHSPFAKYTEL